MNRTFRHFAITAAALGLGTACLTVAQPAKADTLGSFFGSVVGNVAGSLINGAIHDAQQPPQAPQPQPQPPVVRQPSVPTRVVSFPYVQQVFNEYGLTQTSCSVGTTQVYLHTGQVVCTYPTRFVPLGVYQIDTTTLELVAL